MRKPTHEEIARKAYQLWQDRGRLHGTDTEIWLEAEHALIAEDEESTAKAFTATTIKAPATPTLPDKQTLTTQQQKAGARAPQVPHQTPPVAKPAAPGKPLWDKTRSA
jgi:hypothetical protein